MSHRTRRHPRPSPFIQGRFDRPEDIRDPRALHAPVATVRTS